MDRRLERRLGRPGPRWFHRLLGRRLLRRHTGHPSVSQAGIAVPATDNDLHFWYIAYRPDPDDGDPDTAYVKVNGTGVWTLALTQATNTYPNWVEVVLPMAAYAGQNVTLEFGAISAGAATGNIRYDYISFGTPPPPPSAARPARKR